MRTFLARIDERVLLIAVAIICVVALGVSILALSGTSNSFSFNNIRIGPFKSMILVEDDDSILLREVFAETTLEGDVIATRSYEENYHLDSDSKYTFSELRCILNEIDIGCKDGFVEAQSKEDSKVHKRKYRLVLYKDKEYPKDQMFRPQIELRIKGAVREKKVKRMVMKELNWELTGSRNWKINSLETNVLLPPKVFQYVKPENMKDLDIDFKLSLYQIKKRELALLKEFKRKDIDNNNPETKALSYSFLKDKSLNIKYSDIIATNERLFLKVSWLPNAIWYQAPKN